MRSVASRMAVQLALLAATIFLLVPSHSHAKASGAPLAGQAETALFAEVPAGSLGQQARRTVFVASAATNVADADSASDIGFNAQEAAEAAVRLTAARRGGMWRFTANGRVLTPFDASALLEPCSKPSSLDALDA